MQRNRSLKAKPADPHPRCLFCRLLLAMHQRLSQERCLWSRNETVRIIRLLGVPVIGLKFGGFGQEKYGCTGKVSTIRAHLPCKE